VHCGENDLTRQEACCHLMHEVLSFAKDTILFVAL
jgi:hypothetical protein